MRKAHLVFAILGMLPYVPGCQAGPDPQAGETKAGSAESKPSKTGEGGALVPDKVVRTDEEWRRQLTSDQYHVLREKGTEGAFT